MLTKEKGRPMVDVLSWRRALRRIRGGVPPGRPVLQQSWQPRIVDDLVEPLHLSRVEFAARRWGVDPLEAAIAIGIITAEAVVEHLARRIGAGVARPEAIMQIAADPNNWREVQERRWVAVERPVGGMAVLVAPDGAMAEQIAAGRAAIASGPLPILLATPATFSRLIRRWAETNWVGDAVGRLARHDAASSAADLALMRRTATIITILLVLLFVVLTAAPHPFALVVGSAVGILVLAWSVVRVVASMTLPRSLPRKQLGDAELPHYTILCPLHREAAVIPALLVALEALDYPRAKLSILLLVEADDPETQAAIIDCSPGPHVKMVVLPPDGPRTKPKALMLGLALTTSEHVVVYDAEDRPASGQLREAAETFAAAGPTLACLQAPLSIVDAPGMLPRFFAAEYEALFRVLLPAFADWRWPLPLGGTSNHFRRTALEAVGGWDPFNVTEDADLGFRLARRGFVVGTIAEPTREEPPGTFLVWLRQRSRWFKGWMQTLAVLMRQPLRLHRELGGVGCLALAITLAGSLLAALVHLVALAALAAGWALRGPPPWLGAAAFIFVTGYAGSLVILTAGLLRAHRPRLISWLPLLPIVWLAMGLAALVALRQLWSRPFHWEKTVHGGIIWPEDRPTHNATSMDHEALERIRALAEAAILSRRHSPREVAAALRRHALRLKHSELSPDIIAGLELIARDVAVRPASAASPPFERG